MNQNVSCSGQCHYVCRTHFNKFVRKLIKHLSSRHIILVRATGIVRYFNQRNVKSLLITGSKSKFGTVIRFSEKKSIIKFNYKTAA